MVREVNPFTQFGGHLETLGVELRKELEPCGLTVVDAVARLVQPENAWVRAEVAATLKKLANVFRVKVGGRHCICEVLDGSGYTWYNPSIANLCSLSGGRERWATIEVFDIEHLGPDPTDAEIEAEYERRGLARPEVDHAIHFGEQYQNLPVEGHPVVFYLKKPILDADGYPDVPHLWRDGAERELNLYRLNPGSRWARHYRFAGVRE